jgi:hypothetical protein
VGIADRGAAGFARLGRRDTAVPELSNVSPSTWVLALAVVVTGVGDQPVQLHGWQRRTGRRHGAFRFRGDGFGAAGFRCPNWPAWRFAWRRRPRDFLLLNFSPARVFMGDAGSVPLGFLAGGIGIAGWRTVSWPAWFPLLVFSPFVVDASVTLARRMFMRRERFWHPHREHYYQRLVRMGWSHRRLALTEYA